MFLRSASIWLVLWGCLLPVVPICAQDNPEAIPEQPESPRSRRIIQVQPRIQTLPRIIIQDRRTTEQPVEQAVDHPPLDLSGRWLLTLPAGFQRRTQIERLEDGRYQLVGAGNLQGIYEVDPFNIQLYLVEHTSEQRVRFVWEVINDNTLRLRVDENAFGANYLGATLGRQIDWENFEDNSRTTPRLVRFSTVNPSQFIIGRPQETTTITGKACNDETTSAYLETEDEIIFIRGLTVWPEDLVGKSVTLTGPVAVGYVIDGNTRLQVRYLAPRSFSVEGGETQQWEQRTRP